MYELNENKIENIIENKKYQIFIFPGQENIN